MSLALKIDVQCSFCNKHLKRYPTKTGSHFCNNQCKAEWQKLQKPVDKNWLYQKYIVEELSANDIAKIVNRDPKRVWEWLKDYDIETRPRGTGWENNIEFWLEGKESPFKGKKHTKKFKEEMRQRRLKDGHVPYLTKDGKHYMKDRKGNLHHNYKGGSTPERQQIQSSDAWKRAVKEVWHRDNATCQRCGLDHRTIKRDEIKFHIHHMYSFAEFKLLRTNPDNLILLCENCHRWVHSNENVKREFLTKEGVLPTWLKIN